MFDRFRNAVAAGFGAIANRVSTEDRWPEQSRVNASSRTIAGVMITPDSAVTVATVWACLRYLSQTVAVLPWHVMKDGTKGAQIQSSNTVDYMLHKRPSAEWSSFQFRETLTHWALRWGNGYAEIEPDLIGRPFSMWPIHPERVDACRSEVDGFDSYGDEIRAGALFYEVNNGTGGKIVLSAKRMFHVRGFGEGAVGVNVIHYAAQSIGWARAAQIFGASFFGNGATPATVVLNKKPLKVGGLKRQRAEFEQLYKGPGKANRTAFLDSDADIKRIGSNAEETQLIETHQYLVEEICRWFGVPPHKVMHLLRATFSNIEHQAIEVVVDSITPWAKRFEDEADYKMFGQNRQSLYTKMNMNALLRGDTKARMEFYKGMVQIGAYSPNRVLQLEDENTLGPEGDIHVMQQQMVPLEFIAKRTDPSTNDAGGIAVDPSLQPPDESDEEAARARAEFIAAGGRIFEHA
jgi:HK97 family phage portal protein